MDPLTTLSPGISGKKKVKVSQEKANTGGKNSDPQKIF